MSTVLKFIALLLLAIWLPATLHCSLEAAGVELHEHEAHGFDHEAPSCHGDTCDVVEGGTMVKSMSSLRVLPPVVVVDWQTLVVRVLCPVEIGGTYVLPEAPADVLVLQRCWSFARRTALPVRAPDCVV